MTDRRAAETPGPGSIDGRVARRHLTRQRVVDAHAELLREGDLHPTASAVASRAGVSVRALWTNFKDVEGLRAATNQYWIEADDELVEVVPADLPLLERLDRFVAQRQRRMERLAPAVRSSMIALHRSPELARSRRMHICRLRHEIETTFGPELDASPDPDGLCDALMVAASWTSWLMLRDDLEVDVSAGGAVVRRTLWALLSAPWPSAIDQERAAGLG